MDLRLDSQNKLTARESRPQTLIPHVSLLSW